MEPSLTDGLVVAVLSCSDLGEEVANRLLDLSVVREVTLVTAPFRRSPKQFRTKIRQVYRAYGLGGLSSAIGRRLLRAVVQRRRGSSHLADERSASTDPRVHRHAFADFHDPECLALMRSLRADLGVLAGTNILRDVVFRIPRLGCINLHSGKAPEYRGSAPGFWELYNGDAEVGITIHRVAAQLDAGDILLQECFPLDVAPAEDPMKYLEQYRREVLRPEGVRLLAEAVAGIARDTVNPRTQDHGRARTYRMPTYRDVLELRRRVRRRKRALPRRGVKRASKAALGHLLYRTGIYRRLLRNKAVIVLFHRVDDGLRGNPISCTRGEFAAFCDFFKRYFRVVSLSALLDKLSRGEDPSRHLAITFDDGYRDNAAVAAPALLRRGLPACFFVATEFIGSSHVPWWDAEADLLPRWMDWADVRKLQAQGFDIGSHTMNHVDLGVVEGGAAEREIVGSMEELNVELGARVRAFSYPYGRRTQVTEDNRDRVRRAGYSCCLSAFGGLVRPGDDAFRLRRTPISPWYASPYQLGFELLFARSE